MQGLITVADLRTIFSISEDIPDGQVTRHLAAASRRLMSWVGEQVYAAAASNAGLKAELELAEAHLAMHFALLGLNSQLRPTGIVKTERVEGDTVISYLTPVEIDQLSHQFLHRAEEIARPWWSSDATVNADLAVIVESH